MDALQFIPILVVGFATSLGLTPLSRSIALRLGVVAAPTQRNIHQDHKPLMGGMALFFGFALALLLFSGEAHWVELGAVVGGAAFLALIGLLDDRFNLGIGVRLVAQSISALILIAVGIQIRLFGVPLLDYILTVFWVVALANALNFLDNMDGQAAGVTAIASAWFTLIAFNEGLTLVSAMAAAMTGSAVGFLTYNFNPASTFMGDMGSLVLGFVLATLGIKLEFGAQPLSVTWMVPILVLALPIFDTCLVVFTRVREGRSPLQGGKDHTSHRLMSLGLSQRKTLAIIYTVCVLFGGLAFAVSIVPPLIALAIGISGLALWVPAFITLMWIRRRQQG
ncbi:MAG: MraY family glycosyltransferase [Chloroflexota bacterium]|nr:MraY family glycosyltransferase [Chloroflexota bacterium]